MPFEMKEVLAFLHYTAAAAIGSLVTYVMSNPGRSWGGWLFALFSGAFVGYLVGSICNYAGIHGQIVGAISGLAGTLGANNAIRLLRRNVEKKLGIEEDTEEQEKK